MLGTKYVVEISLEVSRGLDREMGRAGGSVDRVHGKVGSLGKELGSLGGKLAGGFTGAVERVGSVVGSMAKVGAVAAFGAVSYGVLGLNNQLETAKTSIAAVLNAQGVTDGMESGLQRATGLISTMRKHAQDLPGEFDDLFGIFQTGIGSALNAGLDDVKFERLSSQAMAAGKALAVPLDQAGRELALLLEGRAGAHNVFGTRLGIDAHKSMTVGKESGTFNQLSGGARVQVITDALGKFEPAIKVFGKTFDAQSSTFVDNIKMFVGASTKDLFGRVTGTLGDINDWFDGNQGTVQLWADKVSSFLVRAWDSGRAAAEEWWPSVSNFAENLYDKFVVIWRDAEPYVKRIGEYVKGMLDDSGTVDKLITLLKLYAVVKVGSGVAGIVGAVSPVVGAAGGISGIGGALSGAGSAAAGAIGGIGGGTLAIGGIVAATIAALGAAGYEVYTAQTRSRTVDAQGGSAYGREAGASKYVDGMVDKAIRVSDKFVGVEDASLLVTSGFGEAATAVQEFSFILSSLAKSGDWDKIAQINAGMAAKAQEQAFAQQDADRQTDFFSHTSAAMGMAALKSLDAQAAQQKKREDGVKGRGQVNIAKVEITVSSNQGPGQIARDVMKEMVNARRYRGSSPGVTNFGAGR